MLTRRVSLALTFLGVSAAWSCVSPQVANPDEQIAQALAAAPEDKADGARILGYATDGSVVEIRAGSNDFICLASNPANERFSSSCYHGSLEPYFARGRELTAEGVSTEDRYRIRFEEMEAGILDMPVMSATQYVFDGEWDSETATATGMVRWVIYVPGGTAESTGLSVVPQEGGPWIMDPGTPGAHIMIVPPRGG
ncbi:MAG: hypothetical protein F4Y07_16715 [Gemmatimonadetes bacterium]|nr:hypothetical protein [Gemmatimonadota bacterium]MYE18114.1 hypothetical protein [Gemmatimonadota bacterium]